MLIAKPLVLLMWTVLVSTVAARTVNDIVEFCPLDPDVTLLHCINSDGDPITGAADDGLMSAMSACMVRTEHGETFAMTCLNNGLKIKTTLSMSEKGLLPLRTPVGHRQKRSRFEKWAYFTLLKLLIKSAVKKPVKDAAKKAVKDVVKSEAKAAVKSEVIVESPMGSYSDGLTVSMCEKGTYQDETGSTSCKPCPSGFTTLEPGAESVDKCSGLLPLRTPVGHRQKRWVIGPLLRIFIQAAVKQAVKQTVKSAVKDAVKSAAKDAFVRKQHE